MGFHPETLAAWPEALEVPRHCVEVVLGNDVRMTWVNNDYFMDGMTHQATAKGTSISGAFAGSSRGRATRSPSIRLPRLRRSRPASTASPCSTWKNCCRGWTVGGRRLRAFHRLRRVAVRLRDVRRLRGLQRAVADLAAEPALVAEMFDRCAAFAVLLGRAACRRFPLDWLWTGDDVAGQRFAADEPGTWRRLIKPHLRLVLAVGKRHRLWVVYHGCGACGRSSPT